jgi:hypothetical protein
LISTSQISLIEAAFLLRSRATRRQLHFADAMPGPTGLPSPIHRPVVAVAELPLGEGSERAFEEAVDIAFDKLERGVG